MIAALNLSQSAALVPLSVVRAAVGGSAENAIALVEGGMLRHAFDVSAGEGRTRCLRVWRGSLAALQRREPDNSDLPAVIEDCLGVQRNRLRGQEICDRWMISRPHVLELSERGFLAGQIEDHCLWVARTSAAAFLASRAVGSVPALKSFIARRALDPARDPVRAPRGQGGVCMELQEAYPPASPETAKPGSGAAKAATSKR